MKNMDSKFRNVSTKVSTFVKIQIARLCKKKGLTEYEMLQMMCDCLVRYMDDQHNLSPELEQAMSIFEHMDGWKDAYNLADHTIDHEVQEAVYITADAEGKKHGFRASLIQKPFMGVWKQTNNVVAIYERMTEVLLPDVYRKLRILAATNDCNSIVDLLHLMIDAQFIIDLDGEYRREFEDANRAENNKPYRYGERTKRKKSYNPDKQPQQTIKFKIEDVPDIPECKDIKNDCERERPPFAG